MEYLVTGLWMTPLGVVMTWNPRFFYGLLNSGKEPSNKGWLVYIRILGVVVTLGGIICLLGLFWL